MTFDDCPDVFKESCHDASAVLTFANFLADSCLLEPALMVLGRLFTLSSCYNMLGSGCQVDALKRNRFVVSGNLSSNRLKTIVERHVRPSLK